MKITIWFVLLLVTANASAAQEKCGLDVNNAPALFSLRLGMSEEEVRQIFGKELKFKPKKKPSERTFFQNFIAKPPPAILPGVRALYLRFFNHRIYQIEIFYENRAEWQTLAEFTSSLATNQNFPNAFWTFKTGAAEIKCFDFTIVADQVLNPRIELTDETSRAAVLETRQKHS